MNALVDAVMGHVRTILTMMVVMVMAGMAFYLSLPREADPDIPIPRFFVSVVHPGISPHDGERLIAKPMEDELRSVEGLKEMLSSSGQSHVGVMLEFEVDFDKNAVLAEIRDKVDKAKAKLPDDSEEPTITEFNTSLFPVIIVIVSGDVPERTLFAHARQLRDAIETVPTVLDANLSGSREELLEVIVDPALMETYDLSQEELIGTLTRNNQLVAAGSLKSARGEFSVKLPGLFENRADVANLPIKTSQDGSLTLSDIAELRRSFKDPEQISRFNGRPAIAIEVTKRLGTNIVETAGNVRAVVAEASADWPDALHVDFTFDSSSWITRSLASLTSSIITAILLVMIVVVAALGARAGGLVGVSIPTSFMLGFLLLGFWGLTINMMIMFGMLLSVGLLVDGAIVIVEYADRKMAEGLQRKEAYALAAKRMFWPIASSTGTTLAAFIPMLFWPGVSGKFMSYLPLTLIIILSASFMTAMFFLPVLGSLVGKTGANEAARRQLKSLAQGDAADPRTMPGFTGMYVRLLDRLMRVPLRVLIVSLVLIGVIFNLYGKYNKGVEFFVDTDPELAVTYMSARGNLSVGEMRRLAVEVEEEISNTEGVLSAFTRIGTSKSFLDFDGDDTPRDAVAYSFLELEPYEKRTRDGRAILEDVRQRLSAMPGIRTEVRKIEDGPPTGKDIQIELFSDNLPRLYDIANAITHHLEENVAGVIDVENTTPLPGIEWSLAIDREMAGRYGADVISVGTAVQLVTDGVLLGVYRPDDADDEVDIRVRFPREGRILDRLDSLRLFTRSGNVPVSNFVERKAFPLVDTISREDGVRRVKVKANTAVDAATGQKINVAGKVDEIRAWLKTQDFGPGVRWDFGGANEEQRDSQAFLQKALMAGLFLMFLILLTQFNSFYHTILTLSTVILSTGGVMVGMLVTGQTFSVIMTGTGIVALAGIVVNNSIVLIDTYQRLKRETRDVCDAVLRTAAQRLRPILLTTITTIFGLLPMAVSLNLDFFGRKIQIGGLVSAWWVQLSTAIVFGLAFATLITLILVPVMLGMPEQLRQSFAKLRGRFQPQPAE